MLELCLLDFKMKLSPGCVVSSDWDECVRQNESSLDYGRTYI